MRHGVAPNGPAVALMGLHRSARSESGAEQMAARVLRDGSRGWTSDPGWPVSGCDGGIGRAIAQAPSGRLAGAAVCPVQALVLARRRALSLKSAWGPSSRPGAVAASRDRYPAWGNGCAGRSGSLFQSFPKAAVERAPGSETQRVGRRRYGYDAQCESHGE